MTGDFGGLESQCEVLGDGRLVDLSPEVAKGAFQAAQRAVRLSPQPGLRSEVLDCRGWKGEIIRI
jgi:hypothetical protein